MSIIILISEEKFPIWYQIITYADRKVSISSNFQFAD